MKTIMFSTCLLLLAAGCTSNSPTDLVTPFVTPFEGIWTGTFTAGDPSSRWRENGSITIVFRDSTYHYTGDYTATLDTTTWEGHLGWSGTFRISDRTVNFAENVTFDMKDRE